MGEKVKLGRVESLFAELDYPATRGEAAAEFDDVTVLFADGEANLGELLAEVREDSFDGPDELHAALQNAMPVEAVGEPGQSEGDA
jgi:hypothetical protein